jgi:hypothetical protein
VAALSLDQEQVVDGGRGNVEPGRLELSLDFAAPCR